MSEAQDSDFAAKLELAWAAGFFDGEGSSYLWAPKDRKHSFISLGVSQVNLGPLEKFKAAVGGLGSIRGPYTMRKTCANAKPIWKWYAVGFTARKVLDLLWPYLTAVKKEQAEAVLAREVNSGKPQAKHRTHCPQGHEFAAHGYRDEGDGHRRCRLCVAEQARKRKKTDKPHCRERTHCPQGHAYAEHGVAVTGGRGCRICRKAACQRCAAKQKALKET